MDCIIVFQAILYLDDILPLIFELKKADIISRPLFVAKDKKTYEFIKKNVVLYDGICSIGGKLTCLNKYKNRYINQLVNIFVLRKYFYKKVVTIEAYRSTMVSILSAFNHKVWKGEKIRSQILNRPFRQAKNNVRYYRAVREDFEIKEDTIEGYDCILLTHTRNQYEEINNVKLNSNCPIVQVGYTRGLKEWRNFLDEKRDLYISKQIKAPYFFFVLSQVGRFVRGEDSIPSDELLKECLLVLKDFNDHILTVFKPHNNTDVGKVQEILKDIGYKNYITSYDHPLLLIKKAKFTFSYTSSSILIDAYFNGCPTVEYAHYDSRFFKLNDGQPKYLECVDYFIHRDPERLKKVLHELIHNDIHVQRDPKKLREDFTILSSEEIREKFNWLVNK